MAKKKKGFFSAVGSFLGSIPAVGKAKKAAKKATKKAKKAVKSAKKKIKAKKKKLKAKVKKAAKKLKKKAKKKIGKVFTKARKIKNNLSKSKMVKKVKKTMKKAVLTTKKAAKVVKKATKASVKIVKKVAKKAVIAAKYVDIAQTVSTVADFIPGVSNVKAIYESVVGKDPFTGRKIAAWERAASAASILGGPLVKAVKHGGKAVVGLVKNGSNSTKKTKAASKPKDTDTPKQTKQENKPKPNTTQAPAGNKKQTNSTPQNSKKPAATKQQGADKNTTKGTGNNRIDYLRNKYGEFTSEELNYRINLRGETQKELQKLMDSGISNKKMGPAFAGAYDKTTGNIYYAINDYFGKVPDLHPLLKSRYDSMPQEVFDSYTFTKGAGSHAEVIALNEALKANPNARIDNFVINVIRTGQSKTKPAGMMFPRCAHCAYLTDGFDIITEVSKNVK